MIRNPRFHQNLIRSCRLLILLFAVATPLAAQSLDVGAPSPVRSNNLTGRIAARDLGDARLTDHYYAFTGTPGDLLITVQSRNLNGDLDVFTAVTLRPLLKLSLYAESSAPITKGIYLRKREDLILRVEARSPNDDEGTYNLYFGGSFEPIAGGPDIAETETTETPKLETTSRGRNAKRVSSVGARIEEPEPPPVTEVAAAPPTSEPTPESTPEAREVESAETAKPTETETPEPTPPRNARSRRTSARRPAPRTRDAAAAPGEEAKPKEESGEVAEPETKPSVPSASGRRSGAAARAATKPPPEPEPEYGPRLVIETNDGTLINRSMSAIKRVTVENGQVVVIGRDGKIDRILLANVVRMSIAP